MNILCKYENKIEVCIFYLFAFLENTYFVYSSVGNGPTEDVITSILKH